MRKPMQPKTIGLREMESLEPLSAQGIRLVPSTLGTLLRPPIFLIVFRTWGAVMALALIVLAVVVAGCFLVGALTDRPLDYIPR